LIFVAPLTDFSQLEDIFRMIKIENIEAHATDRATVSPKDCGQYDDGEKRRSGGRVSHPAKSMVTMGTFNSCIIDGLCPFTALFTMCYVAPKYHFRRSRKKHHFERDAEIPMTKCNESKYNGKLLLALFRCLLEHKS
jgi:hypothetical protein